MVALDLSKINSLSPYHVMKTERGAGFYFTTDYGVDYKVCFLDSDLLVSDEAYELVIANINNKKSPRDRKLRNTVMAIVYEFFEKNNMTLLYICETGDNKQTLRSRLFEYWYRTSPRNSEFYVSSINVKDIDGVQNFATIILRLDNPKIKDIVSEFIDTSRILNDKPQNL